MRSRRRRRCGRRRRSQRRRRRDQRFDGGSRSDRSGWRLECCRNGWPDDGGHRRFGSKPVRSSRRDPIVARPRAKSFIEEQEAGDVAVCSALQDPIEFRETFSEFGPHAFAYLGQVEVRRPARADSGSRQPVERDRFRRRSNEQRFLPLTPISRHFSTKIGSLRCESARCRGIENTRGRKTVRRLKDLQGAFRPFAPLAVDDADIVAELRERLLDVTHGRKRFGGGIRPVEARDRGSDRQCKSNPTSLHERTIRLHARIVHRPAYSPSRTAWECHACRTSLRPLPVEDLAVQREPVIERNAGRIGAGDEEGRAFADGCRSR